MRKLTKAILLAFTIVLGATALTGCRTAHGLGQDVENTGEAIQRNTQ